MIEVIQSGFAVIGSVVTGATIIVAGLDKLAQVTPTTKDDAFVSKAKTILSVVSAIFDKVSVWQTKR